MNAIDPASLPLRDIHLPAAISWWPPAPGWWLLAIALTLGPLSMGLWWRWRQRTRLRRDALLAFAELKSAGSGGHELAIGISDLLRRVALALDSTLDQRQLLDDEWLARLALIAPGLSHNDTLRAALIEAPYNPHIEYDREALLIAVERWLLALPRRVVKLHHV